MESLFGIPAHPFFVHAPVVLMPLAALATLALAARPQWRLRYGPALAVSALVVAGSTILAASSGEPFLELLPIGSAADKHKELGEQTRILTVLFFLAAVVTAGYDRWAGRAPDDGARPGSLATRASTAGLALMGVTTVLALLATVWMIRTGDEGARITWSGILPDE